MGTNNMLGTKNLENNERYNFISKSIPSHVIVVELQECPIPGFVLSPSELFYVVIKIDLINYVRI